MKQDGKDRGNTSLREVKRTPQSDLPRWLCNSERKKYKLGVSARLSAAECMHVTCHKAI